MNRRNKISLTFHIIAQLYLLISLPCRADLFLFCANELGELHPTTVRLARMLNGMRSDDGKRMTWRAYALKVTFASMNKDSNYRQLESMVQTTRRQMLPWMNSNAQTILYPAAAFDSFTVVQLFPQATLYIAVDLNPFLKDITKTHVTTALGAQKNEGFIDYADARAKSMAPYVLGRLQASVPGFRLHNAYLINQEFPGHNQLNNGDSRLTHGLIEFDRGEGTPVQYYLQIQDYLSDEYPGMSSWWKDDLRDYGFDGLLMKAAMYMESVSPFVLTELLTGLHLQQGIFLIETDKLRDLPLANFSVKRHQLHSTLGYGRMSLLRFDAKSPWSPINHQNGN